MNFIDELFTTATDDLLKQCDDMPVINGVRARVIQIEHKMLGRILRENKMLRRCVSSDKQQIVEFAAKLTVEKTINDMAQMIEDLALENKSPELMHVSCVMKSLKEKYRLENSTATKN